MRNTPAKGSKSPNKPNTVKGKPGKLNDSGAGLQNINDRSRYIKAGLMAVAGFSGIGLWAYLDNRDNNDHQDKTASVVSSDPKTTEPKKERREKVEPKLKGTAIIPYQIDQQRMDAGIEEKYQEMIKMQEYWRQISLSALAQFKDADPMMPKLYELLEKKSFYTLPMGPKVTVRAITGSYERNKEELFLPDPTKFEIVYMPEIYAKDMPAPILTEAGGRTMRVAANFKCREWLGIMLAHELSHVHDMIIGGENPHDKSQYLEGEVKAHLLETKLLRAWNPEVFEQLIRSADKLQNTPGATMQDFYNIIETLYPLDDPYVGYREGSLANASVLISSQFELAQKKGASHSDLGQIYQQIVAGNR